MRLDAHPEIGVPSPGAPSVKRVLYMHVPFCESLCPFCSFHRVLLPVGGAARYYACLRKEMRIYADHGCAFSSVYVGGGTPTVMPDELAETLALARELFGVREISVETNPNHLRPEVVSLLKQSGVNRLSVGVQSFDDRLLAEMGRLQPYGNSAFIKARLAETRGLFDTLNADMIFNLPHQSPSSLENDLRILNEDLSLDQLSFYPLMTTPGTRENIAREMGPVSQRHEQRAYETIVRALSHNYRPTSAWCFSRTSGAIDEYIVDCDGYSGIGSGAFSYTDGTLYASTFSIPEYIRRVESGTTGLTARRRLGARERALYELLIRLFGVTLPKARLRQTHGVDVERALGKELWAFKALGAIEEDERSYRLTQKGMYYWVVMMREFFVAVNRLREQMRALPTAT